MTTDSWNNDPARSDVPKPGAVPPPLFSRRMKISVLLFMLAAANLIAYLVTTTSVFLILALAWVLVAVAVFPSKRKSRSDET